MGIYTWHTPKLFNKHNYESKGKTIKEKRIGVRSLVCSTLGIKECVEVPRWGLRWLTSKSIIHTNLHKPNNKLVSV
jgi:hypothetical protein